MTLTPEEVFAEALKQNPNFLLSLKKKESILEFKSTYNVERATPLRCPVCNQYGESGGSLWIDKDNKNKFTCKKCHLQFRIEWIDGDIGDLILKIREENKKV